MPPATRAQLLTRTSRSVTRDQVGNCAAAPVRRPPHRSERCGQHVGASCRGAPTVPNRPFPAIAAATSSTNKNSIGARADLLLPGGARRCVLGRRPLQSRVPSTPMNARLHPTSRVPSFCKSPSIYLCAPVDSGAAPYGERRCTAGRARAFGAACARDPQRRTRRLDDEPPRAVEGPTAASLRRLGREHSVCAFKLFCAARPSGFEPLTYVRLRRPSLYPAEVLLLVLSLVERPVVLARPGPSTPDAAPR